MNEDRLTALEKQAVAALQARAWLDAQHAQELAVFAVEGATEHILNIIAGTTTVAPTPVAVRAERLYFVCKAAKRWLSQREVEVLFRLTPTAARSTMVAAQATYEAELTDFLISDMRQRVQLKAVGSGEAPTVRVRCGAPSVYNVLMNEIHRVGLANHYDDGPGRYEVTLPENVTVGDKQMTIFDALDLAKPDGWPQR
jgi:hypothetical protein